jgi:hypothetical protein
LVLFCAHTNSRTRDEFRALLPGLCCLQRAFDWHVAVLEAKFSYTIIPESASNRCEPLIPFGPVCLVINCILRAPHDVLLASAIHFWVQTLSPTTSAWLKLAEWIPLAILIALSGFGVYQATKIPFEELKRFPEFNSAFTMAIATVFVLWILAFVLCYTVDLSLDRKVMSRSKEEYTEVSVRLGGATSDETKARVELRDEFGKTVQKLDLLSLGNGLYVSYISSTELPGKLYKVVLTYPGYGFSVSYPFFHQNIHRSVSLVIVS